MTHDSSGTRTALTIAGSDPSGGAGVQGDLKTFAAFGVFGTAVVTAVTVQNTRDVQRVVAVAPDLVTAQIDAVVSDLGADATKVGMLATADNVRAVADAIDRHGLARVVVDPILRASAGAELLEPSAVSVLVARLFPLAVVTPNVPEAEQLTGRRIDSVAALHDAARRLVDLGARAAVVTGGHLDGSPVDVVYDGRTLTELRGARIDSRPIHGTGCAFSSALAARLAHGDDLAAAARAAKAYVARAIAQSPPLGHGRGVLEFFPQ
jgi:hydroxymethylpyrimidine/phosphomethylpyrimidine kinase